jgi:hypothetical protein
MRKIVACLSLLLLGQGLVWAGDDKPAGKDAKNTAGFEAMKKLVGDWTAAGPDGKSINTQFRLTAGGSVLVETLFPGQTEEMVTVYHMDGPDLILTHYCMLGNQPRLKAASPKETKKLTFKSIGGTNMTLADMHMGQATFTLVDDDHFESAWCACTGGKPDNSHQVSFKFTRKK